ncbi:hypothetical protein G7054_g4852 [Neopestalotiopsis clavispora]|nr:hypothetical protein G7054_g4852 [Neopestalotiopsis clavispora]
MEIAGLGIGIAGLAGMFTTCLDVMERIDSYKDFGVDSRAIMSQLDAQKLLFKKWGTAVGFDGGRLKDDHHENLDDAATRSAVQNILNSIYEIAGGPERLPPDKQHKSGFTRSKSEPIDAQQPLLEKFRGDASHKAKIRWTLRHKTRFIALTQHFGNLVGTLYNLVPPDATTSMDPMSRQALRGNGISFDGVSTDSTMEIATSSWYIDTERILMDIQKHIERDMKKDLDAWLCASYTSNNYDNFIERRLPGTSDWIMDREAFREWDSSDPAPSCAKVLWVNGPAGYEGGLALAVFFSADLEDKADPFIIGRHWVSQLISRNPEAFNLACEKLDLHKTPIASSSEVMDLLKEMVHTIPQCTLVVDGLDEYCSKSPWSATQSDGLESFVGKIIEAIRGTTTRVFLASREEQEIRSALPKNDHSSVGVRLLEYSITPSDVRPDATKLSESIVSQKLEKKSQTFREEIARRMVDRCDSMLLQIQLLGSEIRATKNQKQTERIIDQTPLGLSNLYDRAWLRIMERGNETPRALAILRWVAFGLRPLTILEMTEALILTDHDSVDNLEDEMPDELNEEYVRREILDFCASLIETRASSSSNDWGSRTVHFTHFTVREYVLQNLQRDPTDRLRVNNDLALAYDSTQNNRLAEICLRYLIMSSSRTKTQHEDTSHPNRSFGVYAKDSFHKHVRRDAENYTAIGRLLIEFFCNEDTQWDDWRRHHDSNLDDFPMLSYDGQASSASPLFYASLLGFKEVVEELVQGRGVDIDHVDESCRTGLLAATHEEKHELMEYFLQRNADINKASNGGFTPLYVAASHGNYKTVQGFLESGADLTITTSNGWTALAAASAHGHLKTTRLLLERDADLAFANSKGSTPLHLASSHGHSEIVKLLLERGADSTIADKDGYTSIFLAADNGHFEVVKILLEKGADIHTATNSGITPLYPASAKGYINVVRLLLEECADINTVTKNGWTPVNAASDEGQVEVVEILLEKGADINIASNNGMTPLYSASIKGHINVIQLLLEKGADINRAVGNEITILYAASKEGYVNVVQLLLEKGADINAATDTRWTPINCASYEGHVEVVKLLLEKGADINIASNNGITPLYSASVRGHGNVVKLLLEKGAAINTANNNGWTPITSASDEGHVDVVRLLLEKGADSNIPINNGWTPLCLASKNGHTEVSRQLLEAGADLSIAAKHGQTPFFAAACNGHLDVAELLLREGADVAALTCHGNTPLHGAANGGHPDVIQFLLRNGANMNLLDSLGRPPLFYAIKSGDIASFTALQCQEFLQPEFQDFYGSNALSFAVRCGHEEMIRALTAMTKQSFTIEDRFRRTPVWWAHKQGNMQMVERVAARIDPLSPSNLPSGPPARFAADDVRCDVCLASVDGAHYKSSVLIAW